MPSQLDVVNYALTEIGKPPVSAFTDQASSILMNYKLPSLLGKFLQLTDWNFAIKFKLDNTPQTVPFSPDFLWSYVLPPDYDRFDRFSWMSVNFGLYYRILDGLINTNMRPIQYYYVVNQNGFDYNDLVPTAFIALSVYLAAEVAMALTNNQTLVAYLRKKYEDCLADAVRFNDMERMVLSLPYNDFDRQAYI